MTLRSTWSQNKKKIKSKTKAHRVRRFVVLSFSFLIIIFFILIYIVRLPQYQIQDIHIEGSVVTKDVEIKKLANQILSGNYFYFIPRTSVFFYPKQKIVTSIETVPSVAKATASLDRKNRILTIFVTDRSHEFVWCHDKDCYYMEKTGLIFAKAPEFEGNIFLVFTGLLSSDPLGQRLLSESDLQRLLQFKDDLSSNGVDIVSISIKELSNIEFITKHNNRIITSLDDDLTKVFRTISILLASKEFNNESGGIVSVDYLDARYGKKIFWKPKEK